ncbi:MAG: ABC transporter ATP-binding protein [bacterium]
MAQHITYDMRNQMFQHLQMMSHRFFTTHNQGDIITRMTSDISGVESVISNTFSSILSNSITLVVAVIAMFQKNWILTLVGLLIVPLFVLPTRKAGKTRWALTNESQAVHDEINGILNETMSVSGQLLVKLFNRENYEYERYKKANHDMIQLNIKESMAGRWFRVILTSFSSIGPMALYFVGGVLMMKYDSSLTVGDITVLVALLSRMYGPVNSLLNIQVDWIRSMALFTRIFDYYDMELEITNSPNAIHPLTARGEIEVKHVDFSYEEGKQILSDINFNLPYGHSVALVGPSGSGKSTVINLIARLYDVDRGAIMFDGVDIRDLDLQFLRKNVGIVTQDSYLFNGTIKDNLLYAKSDASEEELVEACQKAQIYDFIKKQEKGFDTEVGNRGLKLSGGEKQRLSIARIILKDPALFIFDEATSALDSLSEDKIQKAIEPIIESKTSILIAHRLSTILSADEILVIKDGHIVERGTHQSLLKLHGVYKELYDTQYKENKS